MQGDYSQGQMGVCGVEFALLRSFVSLFAEFRICKRGSMILAGDLYEALSVVYFLFFNFFSKCGFISQVLSAVFKIPTLEEIKQHLPPSPKVLPINQSTGPP